MIKEDECVLEYCAHRNIGTMQLIGIIFTDRWIILSFPPSILYPRQYSPRLPSWAIVSWISIRRHHLQSFTLSILHVWERTAWHTPMRNWTLIWVDRSHRLSHGDLGPWTPWFLFSMKLQLQLYCNEIQLRIAFCIALLSYDCNNFSAIGCYQRA